MSRTVHLVLDHPTPAWQAEIDATLAVAPGIDLLRTTRPANPPSAPWRWVVDRCPALRPAALPPTSTLQRTADLTIDLTAQPEEGAWRPCDQHGRPLAAPFPFCSGSRIELPEIRLEDGSGAIIRHALLGLAGDLAETVAHGLTWARRLVVQALSEPAAERERRLGPAPAAGVAARPLAVPILARDQLGRVVRRLRSWFVDETWCIGIIDRPLDQLSSPLDVSTISWIEAPVGSYYADPFGLPGEPVILCERLNHEDGVGRLVSLQAGGDAVWRERPVDLPLRGHASFPFALRVGEDLFCLPENAASGRLTLWRRSAGDSWRPHRDIASDLRAVDPTLFAWGDRWWIAYTDGRSGEHDNLCLMHAATLDGPWRPHRRNPVKVDVRSSRPAGTPYVRNGRLFRPAQDCAARYGAAVVINEVVELSTEAFAEVPALRLAPGPDWPYPDGLHTLTAWGPCTLIDAKREGFVPAAFRRRLGDRLSRAWPGRRQAPALDRTGA